MKDKTIKKILEKLSLNDEEKEKVISENLMRMTSGGLKLFAEILGVEK